MASAFSPNVTSLIQKHGFNVMSTDSRYIYLYTIIRLSIGKGSRPRPRPHPRVVPREGMLDHHRRATIWASGLYTAESPYEWRGGAKVPRAGVRSFNVRCSAPPMHQPTTNVSLSSII